MSDNLTLKTTAAQRDAMRRIIADWGQGLIGYAKDYIAADMELLLDDLDTALAAVAQAQAALADMREELMLVQLEMEYLRDSNEVIDDPE